MPPNVLKSIGDPSKPDYFAHTGLSITRTAYIALVSVCNIGIVMIYVILVLRAGFAVFLTA